MSFKDLFKFLVNLIKNKLPESSILSIICLPLGLNWKSLFDSNIKKFLILALTISVIIYRGFVLIKKLILWPFKLGIFSFLFSIVGIDVTWFLNLFNIFSINIPQWVYYQYLILYSSWLSWWHNVVNIKSLNIISLFKNPAKETLKPDNSDLNEPEDNLVVDKTRLIIFIGFIILVGVGIWYYLYSDFSGGANNPPDSAHGDNHQIEIKDNQTVESKGRPRAKLRRTGDVQPNSVRFNRSLFIEPSGSNTNRYTLLETLDKLKSEGPPSPTNSTDSVETIKPPKTTPLEVKKTQVEFFLHNKKK